VADAMRLRFPNPLLLLLVLAALIAAAAARADENDEIPPMRLDAMGGGLVSFSTSTETALEPMARLAIVAPLAYGARPPELLVDLDLGALPGDSISITDPATFRSLELALAISWRPWLSSPLKFWGGAGFATRLPSDPEPRDRTARWAAAGVRLADDGGNALAVGAGVDERLDGSYQPTLEVMGSVRLWQPSEGSRLDTRLVGRAILGLDFGQYGSARRDVVQVAIAASVGSGDR
jgi:hypothetical protein